MTPSAGDAAHVFRIPRLMRVLSLLASLILGFAAATMLGFAAFLVFLGSWGPAAIVGAVAVLLGALCGYVVRDLKGKWGLRVALQADRMTLDLPAGRSLIHRPRALHRTIAYDEIEAVETRLEAYRSFGLAMMQRAYVLCGKRGERLFLFEDRALGTALATPMVAEIAAAIVARARVPLRDLGMVEGRGGLLSVWGAHAPDWAAPSLPLAQQLRIWRHVTFTGTFAIAVLVIAFLVRLWAGS